MCVQTIFPSAELCDGKDNNCNGAIDEGNPGGGVPCSTGLPGICNNGTTSCAGGAIVCSQTTLPQVENCTDGLDNDCDGLTDCADPNCSTHPSCVVIPPTENCSNGIDDDGDGLIDCFDADCTFDPACAIGGPENCSNGIDDDGDGLIDCADSDCNGLSCGSGCVCLGFARHEANCTDGIDNDGDGLTDCLDTMCAALPICGGGNEVCNDGFDNDGDGYVDCIDGACQLDPRCTPWNRLGTGNPGALCHTGGASPCNIGRESQVTNTCKPIEASCY